MILCYRNLIIKNYILNILLFQDYIFDKIINFNILAK